MGVSLGQMKTGRAGAGQDIITACLKNACLVFAVDQPKYKYVPCFPSPRTPVSFTCLPCTRLHLMAGSNAMQEFDNKAVGLAADMKAKLKSSTMVTESKTRQRNAWGATNTVRTGDLEKTIKTEFFVL